MRILITATLLCLLSSFVAANTIDIKPTPVIYQEPHIVYANKAVVRQATHFVYLDESYFDAINRWFERENIKQIAWSLDNDTMTILNSRPKAAQAFAGTTQEVMKDLSAQLGKSFVFIHDSKRNIAALHQFYGRSVQMVEVQGSSIKDAVAALAIEYKWLWNDDNWQSPHNYPLPSHYPIVTPKGDFKLALGQVIKGYPLNAQLLNSTRTLFITAQ